MTGQDNDFLSRWSRRKRQPGAEEPEVKSVALSDDRLADAAEEPVPDADADKFILKELGLKDPDDLLPGEEFSTFLRAAIPVHLKRRALRRLWGSNPVLANLDGLNDYDGDFTGGGVAPGQLQTAYRVGKGFLRDVAKGIDDPATVSEETPIVAEIDEAEEVFDHATALAQPSFDEPDKHDPAESADAILPEQRRRMSFRFEIDS